jgi:Fe-S cluster biogenesis protein NfuA
MSQPVAISSNAPQPIDVELLGTTLDYIRPAFQADGGDIVLVGVEGSIVIVEMVGACGGCPLSMLDLKAGVERILRERVPGVVDVVAGSAIGLEAVGAASTPT